MRYLLGLALLISSLNATCQTWTFNQGWTESDSVITIFSDVEVIVTTTSNSITLNEYTVQIDSFSVQGTKILFYLSNGGQAIYSSHNDFGPGLIMYWSDFRLALWSKRQQVFIITK